MFGILYGVTGRLRNERLKRTFSIFEPSLENLFSRVYIECFSYKTNVKSVDRRSVNLRSCFTSSARVRMQRGGGEGKRRSACAPGPRCLLVFRKNRTRVTRSNYRRPEKRHVRCPVNRARRRCLGTRYNITRSGDIPHIPYNATAVAFVVGRPGACGGACPWERPASDAPSWNGTATGAPKVDVREIASTGRAYTHGSFGVQCPSTWVQRAFGGVRTKTKRRQSPSACALGPTAIWPVCGGGSQTFIFSRTSSFYWGSCRQLVKTKRF